MRAQAPVLTSASSTKKAKKEAQEDSSVGPNQGSVQAPLRCWESQASENLFTAAHEWLAFNRQDAFILCIFPGAVAVIAVTQNRATC